MLLFDPLHLMRGLVNMKRVLGICFFSSFFIVGCSNAQSIDINNVEAEITTEGNGSVEIQSGDREGEHVELIGLEYRVEFENTGGSVDNNIIEVHIEPSEELVEISNDTLGYNLFDDSDRSGDRQTFFPYLEEGEQFDYSMVYMIGVEEDIQEYRQAPPLEELEELEDMAKDISIILTQDGEEIERLNVE